MAVWVGAKTPPTAGALEIFDREETPADTSPLSPSYRLEGGVQIDQLRSLGRFGGWVTWATSMDDGQICLIAQRDTTTAATCALREEFARTGLTLGLIGAQPANGNAASQRDLVIMWGPDDTKATTADG